jgi:hypothetical protein
LPFRFFPAALRPLRGLLAAGPERFCYRQKIFTGISVTKKAIRFYIYRYRLGFLHALFFSANGNMVTTNEKTIAQ